MKSRWGDDEDVEVLAKKNEKVEVGFQFNFLNMQHMVRKIDTTVGEWDEKYPKDELMVLWGWNVFWMFFLFLLSYSVVLVFTVPLLCFYGSVFFSISKAFKRFKYKRTGYWILTVVVLIAEFAITFFIRHLLQLQ